MTKKVIDPAPIIKNLADRCLQAKGLECSALGNVIDMLKAAPAVYNAPYWATEAAYKNGYEKGYEAGKKDSVEVVHGRWRNNENDYPECDKCGYMPQYDPMIDDIWYSPYCPNCGAKMEG